MDAERFARHPGPAGAGVHLKPALWAFSGWVPLGGIADALALTRHAAQRLLENMERKVEVVPSGGTLWFRGAADHDWDLCARRCTAAGRTSSTRSCARGSLTPIRGAPGSGP